MLGPKKQDFWRNINKLKGNHCILRKWRAPVCPKLDMILKNKVVQKLELEKIFFLQKMASKLMFLKDFFFLQKVFIDF